MKKSSLRVLALQRERLRSQYLSSEREETVLVISPRRVPHGGPAATEPHLGRWLRHPCRGHRRGWRFRGAGVLGESANQGIRREVEFRRRWRSLSGLVLREGLKIQLAALSLGVVASLALAQFLRGFLFEVEPVEVLRVE